MHFTRAAYFFPSFVCLPSFAPNPRWALTAIAFFVRLFTGTHPTMQRPLRDVALPRATVLALQDALATLQGVLREEVRCMLEGWIAQCIRKFHAVATDPPGPRSIAGGHSKASESPTE